jgi:hypothetical protein
MRRGRSRAFSSIDERFLNSPSNPQPVFHERVSEDVERAGAVPGARGCGRRLMPGLFGGGIYGNEQLTAMTGVLLIALLAALGVTILRIGQLIWPHLFLGLLLLGPVLLKMLSTGYRFARYYLRAAVYRAKGPPVAALRAMGPFVVVTTLIVFISGLVLLFNGPQNRGPWVSIHKVSFIVWLVFMGIHVLAHLPGLGRSLTAVRIDSEETRLRYSAARSGAAGRWIALVGAVIAGVVLAVVLIPHFGVWTAAGAFPHQEH